jgi:hypothetical protein
MLKDQTKIAAKVFVSILKEFSFPDWNSVDHS